MGVPPNGLFIREKTIKMDDLGVPLFQETSMFVNTIFGSTNKSNRVLYKVQFVAVYIYIPSFPASNSPWAFPPAVNSSSCNTALLVVGN